MNALLDFAVAVGVGVLVGAESVVALSVPHLTLNHLQLHTDVMDLFGMRVPVRTQSHLRQGAAARGDARVTERARHVLIVG